MSFDPEQDIAIPPVQDREVKNFLDDLVVKKPYGTRLMAHTRQLLETLAKDIEVRAYHGQASYGLDAEQQDALNRALALPLSSHRLPQALSSFAADRIEQAVLRFTQAPSSSS